MQLEVEANPQQRVEDVMLSHVGRVDFQRRTSQMTKWEASNLCDLREDH